MTTARSLGSIACLALLAACAPPPEPAAPPAPTRACQDAFEDLTKYFAADPDRQRPLGLRADTFISTCQQLAPLSQQCMLFSFNQAHASQCDEAMSKVPPELMRRIAAMAGK